MTIHEFGDLSHVCGVTGVTRCVRIIRWLVQGQLCLWPRIREGVDARWVRSPFFSLFRKLTCSVTVLSACLSVAFHRPLKQLHVYII